MSFLTEMWSGAKEATTGLLGFAKQTPEMLQEWWKREETTEQQKNDDYTDIRNTERYLSGEPVIPEEQEVIFNRVSEYHNKNTELKTQLGLDNINIKELPEETKNYLIDTYSRGLNSKYKNSYKYEGQINELANALPNGYNIGEQFKQLDYKKDIEDISLKGDIDRPLKAHFLRNAKETLAKRALDILNMEKNTQGVFGYGAEDIMKVFVDVNNELETDVVDGRINIKSGYFDIENYMIDKVASSPAFKQMYELEGAYNQSSGITSGLAFVKYKDKTWESIKEGELVDALGYGLVGGLNFVGSVAGFFGDAVEGGKQLIAKGLSKEGELLEKIGLSKEQSLLGGLKKLIGEEGGRGTSEVTQKLIMDGVKARYDIDDNKGFLTRMGMLFRETEYFAYSVAENIGGWASLYFGAKGTPGMTSAYANSVKAIGKTNIANKINNLYKASSKIPVVGKVITTATNLSSSVIKNTIVGMPANVAATAAMGQEYTPTDLIMDTIFDLGLDGLVKTNQYLKGKENVSFEDVLDTLNDKEIENFLTQTNNTIQATTEQISKENAITYKKEIEDLTKQLKAEGLTDDVIESRVKEQYLTQSRTIQETLATKKQEQYQWLSENLNASTLDINKKEMMAKVIFESGLIDGVSQDIKNQLGSLKGADFVDGVVKAVDAQKDYFAKITEGIKSGAITNINLSQTGAGRKTLRDLFIKNSAKDAIVATALKQISEGNEKLGLELTKKLHEGYMNRAETLSATFEEEEYFKSLEDLGKLEEYLASDLSKFQLPKEQQDIINTIFSTKFGKPTEDIKKKLFKATQGNQGLVAGGKLDEQALAIGIGLRMLENVNMFKRALIKQYHLGNIIRKFEKLEPWEVNFKTPEIQGSLQALGENTGGLYPLSKGEDAGKWVAERPKNIREIGTAELEEQLKTLKGIADILNNTSATIPVKDIKDLLGFTEGLKPKEGGFVNGLMNELSTLTKNINSELGGINKVINDPATTLSKGMLEGLKKVKTFFADKMNEMDAIFKADKKSSSVSAVKKELESEEIVRTTMDGLEANSLVKSSNPNLDLRLFDEGVEYSADDIARIITEYNDFYKTNIAKGDIAAEGGGSGGVSMLDSKLSKAPKQPKVIEVKIPSKTDISKVLTPPKITKEQLILKRVSNFFLSKNGDAMYEWLKKEGIEGTKMGKGFLIVDDIYDMIGKVADGNATPEDALAYYFSQAGLNWNKKDIDLILPLVKDIILKDGMTGNVTDIMIQLDQLVSAKIFQEGADEFIQKSPQVKEIAEQANLEFNKIVGRKLSDQFNAGGKIFKGLFGNIMGFFMNTYDILKGTEKIQYFSQAMDDRGHMLSIVLKMFFDGGGAKGSADIALRLEKGGVGNLMLTTEGGFGIELNEEISTIYKAMKDKGIDITTPEGIKALQGNINGKISTFHTADDKLSKINKITDEQSETISGVLTDMLLHVERYKKANSTSNFAKTIEATDFIPELLGKTLNLIARDATEKVSRKILNEVKYVEPITGEIIKGDKAVVQIFGDTALSKTIIENFLGTAQEAGNNFSKFESAATRLLASKGIGKGISTTFSWSKAPRQVIQNAVGFAHLELAQRIINKGYLDGTLDITNNAQIEGFNNLFREIFGDAESGTKFIVPPQKFANVQDFAAKQGMLDIRTDNKFARAIMTVPDEWTSQIGAVHFAHQNLAIQMAQIAGTTDTKVFLEQLKDIKAKSPEYYNEVIKKLQEGADNAYLSTIRMVGNSTIDSMTRSMFNQFSSINFMKMWASKQFATLLRATAVPAFNAVANGNLKILLNVFKDDDVLRIFVSVLNAIKITEKLERHLGENAELYGMSVNFNKAMLSSVPIVAGGEIITGMVIPEGFNRKAMSSDDVLSNKYLLGESIINQMLSNFSGPAMKTAQSIATMLIYLASGKEDEDIKGKTGMQIMQDMVDIGLSSIFAPAVYTPAGYQKVGGFDVEYTSGDNTSRFLEGILGIRGITESLNEERLIKDKHYILMKENFEDIIEPKSIPKLFLQSTLQAFENVFSPTLNMKNKIVKNRLQGLMKEDEGLKDILDGNISKAIMKGDILPNEVLNYINQTSQNKGIAGGPNEIHLLGFLKSGNLSQVGTEMMIRETPEYKSVLKYIDDVGGMKEFIDKRLATKLGNQLKDEMFDVQMDALSGKVGSAAIASRLIIQDILEPFSDDLTATYKGSFYKATKEEKDMIKKNVLGYFGDYLTNVRFNPDTKKMERGTEFKDNMFVATMGALYATKKTIGREPGNEKWQQSIEAQGIYNNIKLQMIGNVMQEQGKALKSDMTNLFASLSSEAMSKPGAFTDKTSPEKWNKYVETLNQTNAFINMNDNLGAYEKLALREGVLVGNFDKLDKILDTPAGAILATRNADAFQELANDIYGTATESLEAYKNGVGKGGGGGRGKLQSLKNKATSKLGELGIEPIYTRDNFSLDLYRKTNNIELGFEGYKPNYLQQYLQKKENDYRTNFTSRDILTKDLRAGDDVKGAESAGTDKRTEKPKYKFKRLKSKPTAKTSTNNRKARK